MKKANAVTQFGTTITDFILGVKGVVSIETSTSTGECFTNKINKNTGHKERVRIAELIFENIRHSNFIIKIDFSIDEGPINIVLRGVRGVIKSEDPQRMEDGITK